MRDDALVVVGTCVVGNPDRGRTSLLPRDTARDDGYGVLGYAHVRCW